MQQKNASCRIFFHRANCPFAQDPRSSEARSLLVFDGSALARRLC
jgi:hypothetical protein